MKVLVVDGDGGTAQSIRRMLPDHDVTVAEDAVSAMSLLADENTRPFAAVLCDVGINEVRGLDLLQAARKRRDPPVFIFMTTSSRSVDAAWLADAALVKPISSEELANLVARLVRQKSRTSSRMPAVLTNLGVAEGEPVASGGGRLVRVECPHDG